MPPIHGHDFVELVYVVDGEATHVFLKENITMFFLPEMFFLLLILERYIPIILSQEKRLEIINCLFMPSLIDKIWLNYLGISESMDYYYIHPFFLDKHERFHHCLHLKGTDAGHVLSLVDGIAAEFEEKKNRIPNSYPSSIGSGAYTAIQNLWRAANHNETCFFAFTGKKYTHSKNLWLFRKTL
ncbi:hypothetical protein GCM10020331_060900 [Ectobacillus funiculus]